MELRNLRTFQVAAVYLNFTKTAQELNFTQPTVTAQIQTLEQELNQRLFLRLGKKTFLTPAGEILKLYTDRILALIDEVDFALTELTHSEGNLTIAASETFCTHYFPYIISEYLKIYPNVHIKLLSCHTNEVIKGIESNKFDIGIISGELIKNGITNIVVAEEEDLVLIVSKNLYNRYPTDQLLKDLPFIKYRVDGDFEIRMERYMSESNLFPHKVLEFGSLEAIKRAVLNQIGIGLISRNLVKKEIMDGELISIQLTSNPIKVKTSLIILKEKSNIASAKTFTDTIQSMWNKIHEFEN